MRERASGSSERSPEPRIADGAKLGGGRGGPGDGRTPAFVGRRILGRVINLASHQALRACQAFTTKSKRARFLFRDCAL